jgi:two-component system sensor histidine kinase QseC
VKLPGSLQGRLLLLMLGWLVLLWAASLAYTWREARHEVDELLDSHLAQSAGLLLAQRWRGGDGPQVLEAPGDDDRRGKRQRGRDRDRERDGDRERDRDDARGRNPPAAAETWALARASRTAIQVWHEGRLVLRSANAPETPLATTRSGFVSITLGGQPWRVFTTRGAESDIQVYVAEQMDSRRAIVGALLRGLMWPMALALPLLALGVWWAVRRGLQPLRKLSTLLAARQPQALEPLQLAQAPRELQPLLDALNHLFERIGTLLVNERRFTADAAHELRTPIAGIRAQAQVAIGAGADDAGRAHALRQLLAGCDRAAHLVDQMLTLSRLEAAPAQAMASVDLAALARRVLGEGAAPALARQQQLELDAPQPVQVQAIEPLLQVLLRNLLDNAVRYAPVGAQIRITVRSAELAVEDSGAGVPADAMARLGRRFHRVLGSGEAGSGLGLSIVERIAQVHGAQLRLDASPELGGLRARVVWTPHTAAAQAAPAPPAPPTPPTA